MNFANPAYPRQRNSSNDDRQKNYELTQYTPMGIQHFSAQYKNDPRLLEKLSKRISARVEQDSSDLITFCDKRIRKRRKKKRMEEEQRQLQGQPPLDQDYSVAPEVVAASDLLLGTCLGQGSFSSVFVLEKHLHRKPATTGPRRGRRSRLSRPGFDGTNQGSAHNRSISNHSSMFPANDNNSISRRSTRARSQTPSLGQRFQPRGRNANDESNRSGTNRSQRSRTVSPPRTRSENQKDCPPRTRSHSQKNCVPISANSNHEHSSTQETVCSSPGEANSPIKVLRSPTKKRSSLERSSRSRSLSASIQKGIRAVFRRDSFSNSNHKVEVEDEDFEVPLSPAKKNTRKCKSHHVRPEYEEENNSGRGVFRGGSRSLSLHRRRKGRRSRSRGDVKERTRGRSAGDFEESRSKGTGLLFNTDDSSSGESNLVVKILQPKLMQQPKLFANCAAGLIREGLFLAAIDHPNVLKVHAWTSPNGWMDFTNLARKDGDLYDGYILVLERLQGGSLKGWLRKWEREHEEEQKALAAERSQQKKLNRSLSFTSLSHESNSMISTSTSSRLGRHTVLQNAILSTAQSPNDSPHSYFSKSDRSFPYTATWPTASLADRTSLLLQLSDTVKYLHKHRILHRDLKPDNLGVTFIDPRSDYLKQKKYPSSLSLKVFDFDIARLVPEEPKPEEVSKHRKRRGLGCAGSVASFDAALFNSNHSGRSVSPLRTSNSLTGEDPAKRKRTKKYRGKRPNTQADVSPIPTVISASLEDVKLSPKVDHLFEMTAKMGSPRYMAPEIARGEPYNLRSEVYTVCLLIHEVLTLQKPYDELAPEDHGKLVHFDLPGYRPPVFSEWNWPTELEEVLQSGWGEIHFRPSIKDVHSVLKKALPKICPALLQTRAVESSTRHARTVTSSVRTKDLSSAVETTSERKHHKGRNLFHRSQKKGGKSKRVALSSPLTPTASNSDFSLSNDEPGCRPEGGSITKILCKEF